MRIAIVNRGEAALRLVRAVRELNAERDLELETLALVTRPDRGAPFAREADSLLALEVPSGSGAAAAYLDREAVVQAMTGAGAEAVWVGWGFVAEDPDFAQRCLDAGLRFIGPPPQAMRLCGDKVEAKRLAERCEVPVVPWSGQPLASLEEAGELAPAIGFPLVLKAAAGGGGRGIRRVDSAEGLALAWREATGEAQRAFGDARVFMERCIQRARHLEVQVAVDARGHGVAFGVRDCTVQRRHQKLIEECPGPTNTPALTARLEAWALSFAREAGYRNVGTVEFIQDLDAAGDDPAGAIYFMEMNARLQVEHPVTECVYGVDLVKLQIGLALGEHLDGPAPVPRGAAIEVRLNAEDPTRGFAPAPGLVARFDAPQGPGIRVDSGVMAGSEIPPDFDSNVAKVIAWGSTRREALARMQRALYETAIIVEGGATNKALLAELLADPDVRAGRVDTGWLDRRESVEERPLFAEAHLVAAVLGYREEETRELAAFFAAAGRGVPQRLPDAEGRTVKLAGGLEIPVCCVGYRRYLANNVPVELVEDEPGIGTVIIDRRPYRLLYHLSATVAAVELGGAGHRIARDTGGLVRAPAPAMIMHIAVREGERVVAGQRLVSLEAMKMEMPLLAPRAGRIGQILVVANSQVGAGQPILALEAEEEADPAAAAAVTLPESPDPLADRGTLTPEQLEAQIARIMLGYDECGGCAERLLAVLDDESWWERAPEPHRWAPPLASALHAFVDVERLFARDLLPHPDGGPRMSLSSGFYDFARHPGASAEERHPELVAALERVLVHYGVHSVEAGPRLRHALARIAVAHGRKGERAVQRHRLVSSILRVLMCLHRAGADLASDAALRGALEELPLRARRRWPFVHDNAMQCRTVLYHQPRPELQVETLLAEGRIDELVENPRSMFQRLLPATQGRLRKPAALALFRRMYSSPVRSAEVRRDNGALVVDMLVEPGRRVHGVVTRVTRLEGALTELWQRLAAATEPRVIDLVVHRDRRGVEPEDVRQTVADALEAAPEPARARLERLCLIVATERGIVPHYTFVPDERGVFAERRRLRDLHPEMEERLELWRLDEFELVRQASHDRLVVFQATARSNPRDERIVVISEVRDVPLGEVLDSAPAALLAFEQAFMEATRAVREIQWRRARRARYVNNRIVLNVRPAVTVRRDQVMQIADRLIRYTGGLGLERVVVRARMKEGPAFSDVEMRFTNPTGHGLQVRVTAPSPLPVPAATGHELKARRARAMGVAYPYEVIEMLVGRTDGPGGQAFGGGSFVEHDLHPETGQAVAVKRPPGENTAGVVFGVISHQTAKHKEGMRRVILLSDPLQAMGALSEPECRRINAALDLAEAEELPVEWLATSAGALISMASGTENLDWTARTLRRIIAFTEAGGAIHVVIDGVNVGAQSYFNAEATMLMHTRGALIMTPRGSMVLTGKKALDYSGSVSAEDERGIGGYERIMGPNGQAQYFARDLGHAFRTLLELYDYSYVAPGESGVRSRETVDPLERDVTAALEVSRLFSPEHNGERKKPFDMRAVMSAVKDTDSSHLERYADMRHAETAVVWDTHLGGQAISLIGIESRPIPRRGWVPGDGPGSWTGGTLFPRSSKKVARALRAASGNRPVVVLANLSGFDGSPESMRRLQLEYGAEIGRAVTQFEGRIVFCVVARYHGGAYVVFSKALNPGLVALAVDGSYASVIGGAPAAAVVFPREVRARTASDARLRQAREELAVAPSAQRPRLREALARLDATVYGEKQGDVAREFDAVHSVSRARGVGSLDDIIAPQDLRPSLIAALNR